MEQLSMFAEGMGMANGSGKYQITIMRGDVVRTYTDNMIRANRMRMELQALIRGFKKLTQGYQIDVCVESDYIIGAVNGWLAGCVERGYKKSDGQDIQNKDLWMELVPMLEGHQISWINDLTKLSVGVRMPFMVRQEAKTEAKPTLEQIKHSMTWEDLVAVIAALAPEQKKALKKTLTTPRKKAAKAA